MGHELKPIPRAEAETPEAAPAVQTPRPSSRWPLDSVVALCSVAGWRLEHLEMTGGRGLQARLHQEGARESWWTLEVSADAATVKHRRSEGVDAPPPEHTALEAQVLESWARDVALLNEAGGGGVETAEELLDRLAPAFSADGGLGGGWRLREIVAASRGEDPRSGYVLECFHPDHDVAYHLILRSPAVDGELRVGAIGVHDYVAGPDQWASVAVARARVLFALSSSPGTHIVTSGASTSSEAPIAGVLDADARARFERDGYLVIPGLVAPERIRAAREAVDWFLGLDPSLRDRWYYDVIPYVEQTNLQRGGTFLELYQHQALWDLRADPAVYGLFRDLWGREDLWVSLDRVGYKPPRRDGFDPVWRDDGCVHWDVDLDELPLPFGVQGLIALTDATEAHGTFQCAPGMHRRLEAFVADSDGFTGRHPGSEAFEMVPVELKAGDLLVWHHGLPHRTGPNETDELRLVFYVHMAPARGNEQERLERIRAWRDRLPGGSLYEGDPLQREERHGATAKLTALGERLLGLAAW